jgi:hypothetical protein
MLTNPKHNFHLLFFYVNGVSYIYIDATTKKIAIPVHKHSFSPPLIKKVILRTSMQEVSLFRTHFFVHTFSDALFRAV